MKITTIRGILVLLAVLSAFIGKGQNLVPNPSFEEFDVCPPSTINTITTPRIRDFIRYWQDPPSSVATGPSSDYSHLCSENYNSTIVSATGAGHMGIFVRAGSSEYREYLQVRLLAPLCNGHTYEVKFKLADRDYTQFNVDRIGAHFSLNAVSSPADGFNINVTPQVTTPAGQFINNENNWREFTMNFVNTGGGEEWLTIGNFFNNANTNTQNGSGFFGGYIYIDDVSVIDITPSVIISSGVIANASCGVNDGSITGITVSGGSGSYSYEWLDTDNNIVSTNLDLVNVAGGDYRLIVDDAGCENLAG
ncbi:MAG: SprB repeat-containing protein [Bacteroidota bacterium]